jgi:hypothetical protein
MHHAGARRRPAAHVMATGADLGLVQVPLGQNAAPAPGTPVMLIAAPMNSATDVKRICGVEVKTCG